MNNAKRLFVAFIADFIDWKFDDLIHLISKSSYEEVASKCRHFVFATTKAQSPTNQRDKTTKKDKAKHLFSRIKRQQFILVQVYQQRTKIH